MLYHITFHMDRQALIAAGEAALKVRAAEVERAIAAQQAGRLIGFWRRADGNGVIFILDSGSHEALHEEISSLPMFPYVKSIDVLPLLAYPGFPEFAKAQKKSNAV